MKRKVTHFRLQQLLDIHTSDLSRKLRSLCENEFITSKGRGRGKVYSLNTEHPRSLGKTNNINNLTHSSEHLKAKASVLAKAHEIGREVREKRKIKKESLYKIIILILKLDWFSIKELANCLERSPETLRTHYLKEMIENGDIELKHPESQNHPNQKYRNRGS